MDLKKERKDLYQPGRRDFVEVVVPPMRYLAVDGHGDPNTAPAYAAALALLYPAAYGTKFATRRRCDVDVVVPPLEGLWSSVDPGAFTRRDKGQWDWTMLIALHDVVNEEDIAAGRAAAAKKQPDLDLDALQVIEFDEGRCLQILHIGSYDDEAPTLARLHDELMPARGLTFNGPHHEIYLSDARRVPAERLRTVLRQPVRDLA